MRQDTGAAMCGPGVVAGRDIRRSERLVATMTITTAAEATT